MLHLLRIIQILLILFSIGSLLEPNFGFISPFELDVKKNVTMIIVHVLAVLSVIQFVILGIKRRRGEIPVAKTSAASKGELKPSSSEYILKLNKMAFAALVVLALITAYVRGSADPALATGDSPIGIYIGTFVGFYLILIIVYRLCRGSWGSSDAENKKKIMIGLGVATAVFIFSLLNSLNIF